MKTRKSLFCIFFLISVCGALVSCTRQAENLPRIAAKPPTETAAVSTEADTAAPTALLTAAPTTVPTTVKPTAAKPTTTVPTTVKPTATKPTTTKPTTTKPTTTKPTTTKPTTTKPTTTKPTATKKSETSTAAFSAEALRLTNAARAKAGRKALGTSAELQRCADVRAEEIKKKFSHTRPNGQSCFSLNPDLIMGENIASGQKTPQEVVNGWMNSKEHRENILRERFTLCAVGCYYDKANNKYYWVQLFA